MDNGAEKELDNLPLRWGHYRVLLIASCGQFLGAVISTLIGVILPLIKIAMHDNFSTFSQSMICVSELLGIVVGSVFVGRITEKYGYLLFFRIAPCIIFSLSVILLFTTNTLILTIILFFIGCCIGSEYAIDGAYVSEIMPQKWRFIMVGIVKGAASIGYVITALICFFSLKILDNAEHWNYLTGFICLISLIMILTRIRFVESPKWLIVKGKEEQAQKDVRLLLGNDVIIGKRSEQMIIESSKEANGRKQSIFTLEKLPKIILSGVPWACEGVGVYGIGMFTPILILSLNLEPTNLSELERVIFSVKTTAFISVFIILGFIVGIIMQKRFDYIKMQSAGFFLAVAGLIVLLIGYLLKLNPWISLSGFMFFEFALNFGPHLLTFVIPSTIYNIEQRAIGEGIATAIGKVGALVGVFTIPFLLKSGGGKSVLIFTIIIFLIGGLVTYIFGKIVFKKNKIEIEN